jgi:trigger factor
MAEEENTPTTPEPQDDTGATATAEADAAPEAPAKLRQDVVITDSGPCKKHIKVTVNRDDIDTRIDEKMTDLVRKDHPMVAGFRPGKAPRKVIERRFQKEVHEQVRGEVLMASLEQIAEDHDVAPLAPPNINPAAIEIPKEGPMIYEFDVEVRPEFDLPDYKHLKLKRPIIKYTDVDVAREERRILEPLGEYVPKGENTTIEVGDSVVADMQSKLGDRVMNDVKDVRIRVDERLALKDGVSEHFGQQMKGAKVGDTRVVDIVLSDAVTDPALRGQTVKSSLTVKEVLSLKLPELTQDVLMNFGVRTREALQEKVRVNLDRQLDYLQRQSIRQQVLQMIDQASKWQLPQDLLQRQARRTFNQRVLEMRSSGMTDEEIAGRQRLLERDVLQSTAMALKEQFVLHKIAEEDKLEVEEGDIDTEIEMIADRTGETPRRVRARLERDDLMETLAVQLLERKALDLILENAEYEDVAVGEKERETSVATVETQAVEGELTDSTAPPPEPETPESTETK